MYNMHMQQNPMQGNQMRQPVFNGCAWLPDTPGMVAFPDMNGMTSMNGSYGAQPPMQSSPYYNMSPMRMQRGGMQDMSPYMMQPMQSNCFMGPGGTPQMMGNRQPSRGDQGGFPGSPPLGMMMWPS